MYLGVIGMKNSCCYKCYDRHLSCHSTCERYQAEREEAEKRKAELYMEKQIETDLSKLSWNRVTTRNVKRKVDAE